MIGSASASAGYRADIDGLRAIAVLSVVLYHINNAWVPGGYVGVDIFFVISGYLITRNIWAELQAGSFSLTGFYLRRIRRIAPAFLVVTALTLLAGGLLLLPADLLRLAQSARWAVMSAANIYFWKHLDISYFAADAAEEPLLHMWSLGVEEQYYLIWPALLMLLALARRFRTATTIAVTIIICLASFAIAELTNTSAPKFSYYMLPARAGELMLGALLSFYAYKRLNYDHEVSGVSSWIREAVCISGLGLIAFSLTWLDDSSPFPGINAVYPCVGAMLVMLSGLQGSRLNRVLLTPGWLVYVGLISYSLYLWHWPILAFIHYFYGGVSATHAAIAVVAMFGLSVASYRWVEQPARRARMPQKKQVLALLLAPVAVISLAAVAIMQQDGLKSVIESEQFRSATDTLNHQTAAANRSVYPCMDAHATVATMVRDKDCFLGATSEAPSVFLWGDSNAGHYIGALEALADHNNFSFRYASLSTCPAVFGAGEFGASYARDSCAEFREGVRNYLKSGQVETAVLASQWSVHDRVEGFRSALERTVDELTTMGVRVVVLGQVPWFSDYNRECELRWTRIGTDNCEERSTRVDDGTFTVNKYLAKLASRNPMVSYAGIHDVLCQDGRCSPYVDGQPVYYNPTHLSWRGSRLIGEKITSDTNYGPWFEAFGSVVAHATTELAGGYPPSFAYDVRSQRHELEKSGQYLHIVNTEFIDIDAQSVAKNILSNLTQRGYEVTGPVQNQAAAKYVARRDDLTLVINIYADPELALVAPGAQGIVSFAWRD